VIAPDGFEPSSAGFFLSPLPEGNSKLWCKPKPAMLGHFAPTLNIREAFCFLGFSKTFFSKKGLELHHGAVPMKFLLFADLNCKNGFISG
jgi:hypothetical protein